MKIRKFERVIYDHNPLVEVVCQVSFERLEKIQDEAGALEFGDLIVGSYPHRSNRQQASIQLSVGDGNSLDSAPLKTVLPTIFDFASDDSFWKVSFCADFLTLTCSHYSNWEEFRGRLDYALGLFIRAYGLPKVLKVGLRYKDVIERESIGLAKTPWSELLADFVCGSLMAKEVTEEGLFNELSITHQNSQSLIDFDGGKVLLQAALLHGVNDPDQRAFLIDSDFFEEFDDARRAALDVSSLHAAFEKLHANAGALFRLCIKEKLHDALGPRAV